MLISIGIIMHFIDIFLIGIMFDVTPLLILCFEQKGGEHFIFTFTPLLMIDEKGEKNLSLQFICMFLYACFYVFIFGLKFNWYQKHYLKNMFIFGIKSFFSFVLQFCFANWYQELVLINVFVLFNLIGIKSMF